jgi:hypothetical protein
MGHYHPHNDFGIQECHTSRLIVHLSAKEIQPWSERQAR